MDLLVWQKAALNKYRIRKSTIRLPSFVSVKAMHGPINLFATNLALQDA
jgi:hypothetical protein